MTYFTILLQELQLLCCLQILMAMLLRSFFGRLQGDNWNGNADISTNHRPTLCFLLHFLWTLLTKLKGMWAKLFSPKRHLMQMMTTSKNNSSKFSSSQSRGFKLLPGNPSNTSQNGTLISTTHLWPSCCHLLGSLVQRADPLPRSCLPAGWNPPSPRSELTFHCSPG